MVLGRADDIFVRHLSIVLLLLLLLTVAVVFATRGLGERAPGGTPSNSGAAGASFVGDASSEVEQSEAAPADRGTRMARSGEDIYNFACAFCHAIGAGGAPKMGDRLAWATRLAKGLEGLVDSAVNGKNLMPARGGNPALSDGDVRNAVKWMLEETGIDLSPADDARHPR